MEFLLLIIALLFCGLRIAGVNHEIFQAFAHLFVGYLLGSLSGAVPSRKILLWTLIGVLVVIEVACAIAFHFLT